jgi:DNA (cytosine-5)-methyltransferase 1
VDREERTVRPISAPSVTQTLFPPSAFGPADAIEIKPAWTPFSFIDLFAGIGGIRMGLETVGGRSVYTVEFDRWAMETYNANFAAGRPDGSFQAEPVRDIYDVDVADIPAYDLLAAGFPCQPFSIAGVSKNTSLGREHGFAHEKSGNLFFQIARLIDEAESPPRVLFLENVKHLVSHDGGNTFRVISETLKDFGYNVAWKVVDSSPWVPQRRHRTFIIGLHRDVYGAQAFVFPPETGYPPKPWPMLASILEPGKVEEKYTLTPHLWEYLKGYARKHQRLGNGFGFGKFGPEDVARTLSARYYKDGSEILIETGEEQPRRLTPRECARLMGYPESFHWPVSDMQAYKQFGNSVVVPVIGFLARELVRQAAHGFGARVS